MALLKFEDVSFWYAVSGKPALQKIHLAVQESELVLIIGSSGSGKTTLIKQMKRSITPYGKRDGKVTVNGVDIHAQTDEGACQKADELVGFVSQNPDNQIVTDKVWHELAFGLENMGLPPEEIRRRSAETASYFGIAEWYRQETARLSGGQKQLLNLAAVMAMRPRILVLDEPAASLDPIAAERFLDTVVKLNRELGITVILTEHRTERIFPEADRIVAMDGGLIQWEGSPKAAAELAKKSGSVWLPAAAKIYIGAGLPVKSETAAAAEESLQEDWRLPVAGEQNLQESRLWLPLTVREGRQWIKRQEIPQTGDNAVTLRGAVSDKTDTEIAVLLKGVSFRYERYGKEILEDVSLSVGKREIFAILGGNGSGKSTLLKLIAGVHRCVGGKIRCAGRVLLAAQNPQAMFTEISAEEELAQAMIDLRNVSASGLLREEKLERVEKMLDFMDLKTVRKQNPYDLSGGQQQKLALAKALLFTPDILLLDEPTKGLDPIFKEKIGLLLQETAREKTVILVSHDVEFCAEYAHRCGLLFDGRILSEDKTERFFSGNSYYTTAAARITEGILSNCVTCGQAVNQIKNVAERKESGIGIE